MPSVHHDTRVVIQQDLACMHVLFLFYVIINILLYQEGDMDLHGSKVLTFVLCVTKVSFGCLPSMYKKTFILKYPDLFFKNMFFLTKIKTFC